MADTFVPGSYWTVERARAAVDAMTRQFDSPEMQAMMAAVGDGMDRGEDPAAMAAMMAGQPAASGITPIRPENCAYRRGTLADVPAFAALIVHGELPPLFIDPFAEGFVAVEHEGELVGCGALEVYDGCGVVRSVVVSERGRGQRIGEEVARLLTEDALAAGVTDLYLFTLHAHAFWQRLGYADVTLDAWKQPARACWQWRFMERFPGMASDIFTMWRRVEK